MRRVLYEKETDLSLLVDDQRRIEHRLRALCERGLHVRGRVASRELASFVVQRDHARGHVRLRVRFPLRRGLEHVDHDRLHTVRRIRIRELAQVLDLRVAERAPRGGEVEHHPMPAHLREVRALPSERHHVEVRRGIARLRRSPLRTARAEKPRPLPHRRFSWRGCGTGAATGQGEREGERRKTRPHPYVPASNLSSALRRCTSFASNWFVSSSVKNWILPSGSMRRLLVATTGIRSATPGGRSR